MSSCHATHPEFLFYKEKKLLCFSMKGMLAAERAMLTHLESVRSVFLFLHCVVVSALAFCANERDFCSHNFRPPKNNLPP